jgi:hypothetical protein
MKSKLSAALVAGCVLALSGGVAYAATITNIITFTASGFFVSPYHPNAPVDPVIGSFTITLDPTVDNLAGTSVVVNSINIPGGGTPFFLYYASVDGGRLALCSSANPFPVCHVGAGVNSFLWKTSKAAPQRSTVPYLT